MLVGFGGGRLILLFSRASGVYFNDIVFWKWLLGKGFSEQVRRSAHISRVTLNAGFVGVWALMFSQFGMRFAVISGGCINV